MAENKKISEFLERSELTGQEMFPLANGGGNGRVTAETLKGYCATPIGEAEGTAFDGGRGKAVEDIINNINKSNKPLLDGSINFMVGTDKLTLRYHTIDPNTGTGTIKDTVLPNAKSGYPGVMSAADKQKLDSLSTEALPTFSLTDDLASGSGVISSLVWERLTAARTANTPIVVVNDMGSLPVANVAILSFGHNAQQQGTTDIIMPARINDLEDHTVTQTVYQITGGGSTYQIATVTKNLKFYDSGDGTKFLSDDGTYKAIEIPDISNLATKDELNAKVSTETYNADKATFALKSEIPTDYATEGDIQEAISGINIEDLVMYGVEFDTTVSSPDCKRIGNPNLHRTLPVHSQMKGCLLNDDGEVTKYLNESDWTSETRDGSQGQVMVEVPEHYVKFETDGTKRRVKMSITPIVGYKKIAKYYISAYEATVQRSASKLSSVVNTDADYRGGNNNYDWDGTYRSLLGMPATSISRTNFRTYARNRKEGSTEWNCMTYDIQKDLYWLFVVEYATLNTQKAFNSAKTAEGYAQGGLGDGVTNLNSSKWNTFNGYYPVIPCGHTDSLGNGTGEVDYQMPEEYDSAGLTVKVPRYRGIENPFGHLWQWTDGINVRISPNEPTGDGLSKVFVTDNPEYFNDSNYNNMSHVDNEARAEGYVKSVIFGEGGEIMPLVVGAGSTTYFCDYHYTYIPTNETLRGVLFGGNASDGADAGFVYANSYNAPSNAHAPVGSRLCFIHG